MAGCKRKQISLSDKLSIINAVDNGEKQADIARRMGLSKQTVNSIVKNKDVAEKRDSGELQEKRFRMRKAAHPEVESALLMWLRDARARGIPVNGLLLRSRAEQLAAILGHGDVTFSEGWLSRFKARHGVVFSEMCGERDSVDQTVVSEWQKNRLPALLAKYEDRNIFNADESGLVYKARPSKTYTFSGERCHGGKCSKERLSVLFCCNMDGSEKVRLLLIGKSKRPRALRQMQSLSVDWEANKKAWMTKVLFNTWLVKFDRKMAKEKRKVLLFLDNCSAHMQPPVLEATEIAYFPPNATSALQPIDQGVVHSVKVAYRTRLTERLLFDMNAKRETKIDVKFPVEVLPAVWAQLKRDTIRNCFRKAGFCREDDAPTTPSAEPQEPCVPTVWPQIQEAFGAEDFADFVSFDDDVVNTEDLTDDEIVAQVRNCSDPQSEEDSSEEAEAPVKLTSSQALEHIEALKGYFVQQQHDCSAEVLQLTQMQHKVTAASLAGARQALITQYVAH
uniref:Putative tick transposon n=1 Tax=Ixodes ricinus TaxID=34613 RepID=A0A147BDF0_IXORI